MVLCMSLSPLILNNCKDNKLNINNSMAHMLQYLRSARWYVDPPSSGVEYQCGLLFKMFTNYSNIGRTSTSISIK